MGQIDSKVSVKEGDLQKFGKVEYLVPEQPNQKVRMRVNMQINREEEDYKEWVQKMQRLKKYPEIAEFVVLPIAIQSNNCLVCTNTHKKNLLTIYYEKINFSLFQVIKNRRYFKKYFTETQIWYLLYVMIKVAAYFEERSDHVGNIHTTNVMLNEKSRIKLFTVYSSPAEQENLVKIKEARHTDTYIAPEEIRFIHEDTLVSVNACNRNKIDLFNIGLVLLSTVLLKECYYVYTRTLFELNEEKLQGIIEEMKKSHLNVRYSLSLLNIIQDFVIIDPAVRKTPKYYYQILKKYEGQILELQPFNLENHMNQQVISPEVCNYLQKVSPNTKQTKFLSLAKNLLQKNASKEPKMVDKQVRNVNQQTKITRKLFNE